jgi:hypothetical protein
LLGSSFAADHDAWRDVPGFRRVRDRERDMADEKIRIEQHSFMGSLWFAGWLFTLGYLQLTFWKGLVALVVWPYFLGAKFSPFLH